MQKEKKTDCPVDLWMSAKICLPDGKRGFAVGKIVEEADRSMSLVLTLDQTFIGHSETAKDINKWNSIVSSSHENLLNLPKGTAILLAPPKVFGAKFWIARVDEPNKLIGFESKEENCVSYSLHELRQLKNFLEARSAQRVMFRTPVLLVDPATYTVTQFFTRDISQNGLSISIDAGVPLDVHFEAGKGYLMQLKIHEGMTMPAMNYKCVHVREDILTGAKIIGFSLDDHKAKDPEVEYNLTLLTWSDSSPEEQD
jgi:hypothetical protein